MLSPTRKQSIKHSKPGLMPFKIRGLLYARQRPKWLRDVIKGVFQIMSDQTEMKLVSTRNKLCAFNYSQLSYLTIRSKRKTPSG